MVFAPRFAAGDGNQRTRHLSNRALSNRGWGSCGFFQRDSRHRILDGAARTRFCQRIAGLWAGIGWNDDSHRYRLDDGSLGLAGIVRNFCGLGIRGGRALALVCDRLAGRESSRERPGVANHSPRMGSVNARPQRTATRAPWMKMFSSLSVWALILGYGFQGYAFYVYYNWFYLRRENARTGLDARRGMDFSALSCDGGVVSGWRMVF